VGIAKFKEKNEEKGRRRRSADEVEECSFMVYSTAVVLPRLHYVNGGMIDVCRCEKDLTRSCRILMQLLSFNFSAGTEERHEIAGSR
jgi:hypothetical protein